MSGALSKRRQKLRFFFFVNYEASAYLKSDENRGNLGDVHLLGLRAMMQKNTRLGEPLLGPTTELQVTVVCLNSRAR